MSMIYGKKDLEHLKRVHQLANPDVELVECSGGLWRTPEEKLSYDLPRPIPEDHSHV